MYWRNKRPAEFYSPLFYKAFSVIRQLENGGFNAYIVGGSLRDALLGRPVHDIDIATSATPEDVQSVFPHTVPTGLKYGTVTVKHDGATFEVTTFRREGPYDDQRRPSYVRFMKDIKTDLSRRDFTINAMALNRDGEIIDPFDGNQDLRKGIIRCVGDASTRFREDSLRMLRAIRFAAELGFTVDDVTLDAMKAEARGLDKLAAERVRSELHKTLSAPRPGQALKLLWSQQMLHNIKPLSSPRPAPLPEQKKFAQLDSEPDVDVRWVLFLWLCNVEERGIRRVLRQLKMPRKKQRHLSRLWDEAVKWPSVLSHKEMRFKLFALGLRQLIQIIRLAHYFGRLPAKEVCRLHQRCCHADWEMAVSELAHLGLDSRTLMRLSGRKPGPWIGEVQRSLLHKVVSDAVANDPATLEREWRTHGPFAP